MVENRDKEEKDRILIKKVKPEKRINVSFKMGLTSIHCCWKWWMCPLIVHVNEILKPQVHPSMTKTFSSRRDCNLLAASAKMATSFYWFWWSLLFNTVNWLSVPNNCKTLPACHSIKAVLWGIIRQWARRRLKMTLGCFSSIEVWAPKVKR